MANPRLLSCGLIMLSYVAAACSGASGGGGGDMVRGANSDLATAQTTDFASLLYAPAGYHVVPFLSDSPEHSFAMADMVLDAALDYQAVLDTDAGRIVMDLYEKKAPITVNSFVFLTLHHFYDGIAFHRVVDKFVAQAGDPNSISGDPSTWGTGDPGYFFGLEIDASLNYGAAGVVGMARTAAPDTNGSQFFLTLAAAHNLDGKYTIFATVTEGLDVLPKIVRGMPPAMPTRIMQAWIVAR